MYKVVHTIGKSHRFKELGGFKGSISDFFLAGEGCARVLGLLGTSLAAFFRPSGA
jgi:hypothetical protein